jgi:predicted dehydrogenase
VQLIDICLPTSLHAHHAIKALQAGKHVLCEKPIALTSAEAAQIEEAYKSSGKQLMIGHCLRYWPQYLKAHEIIESGDWGKPIYARFHRSGATPTWSWDGWLQDGARSGGAVLDMHIHDVDTAIWWFGIPNEIHAAGYVANNLPMSVDATWRFNDGLLVYLHGSWDDNGGPFRMSYKVVLEKATLDWDSSKSDAVLLHHKGETEEFEVSAESAYQVEIDDFIACLAENRTMTRVTPQSSRETLEVVLEELRQIKNK